MKLHAFADGCSLNALRYKWLNGGESLKSASATNQAQEISTQIFVVWEHTERKLYVMIYKIVSVQMLWMTNGNSISPSFHLFWSSLRIVVGVTRNSMIFICRHVGTDSYATKRWSMEAAMSGSQLSQSHRCRNIYGFRCANASGDSADDASICDLCPLSLPPMLNMQRLLIAACSRAASPPAATVLRWCLGNRQTLLLMTTTTTTTMVVDGGGALCMFDMRGVVTCKYGENVNIHLMTKPPSYRPPTLNASPLALPFGGAHKRLRYIFLFFSATVSVLCIYEMMFCSGC